MKKLNQFKLLHFGIWTLLSLALVTTMAACQIGRQDSPRGTNVASSTPPVNDNGSSTLDGPGHTGGGNGINLKVYDSYIVDPTQISGYALVKPIISQLQNNYSKSKRKANDNDSADFFANFLKLKTWYLIPQHLKNIPNQVLGVLTSESSDQYALQTDKEILIDANYFEKMKPEDQAQLILHEYVMSIYLIKFKSFEDLCSDSQRINGKSCSNSTGTDIREIMDYFFQPEALRSLDSSDYDNIRVVTNLLWKSGTNMETKDLFLMFQSHGFDRRLFNDSDLEPVSNKSISLKMDQFEMLFQKAMLSHALPSSCKAVSLNQEFPCHWTWTKDSIPIINQAGNKLI